MSLEVDASTRGLTSFPEFGAEVDSIVLKEPNGTAVTHKWKLQHLEDPNAVDRKKKTPEDGEDENGEKFWIQDRLCRACRECGILFSMVKRRHHCRLCGQVFCDTCSNYDVTHHGVSQRACIFCFNQWQSFEIMCPTASANETAANYVFGVPDDDDAPGGAKLRAPPPSLSELTAQGRRPDLYAPPGEGPGGAGADALGSKAKQYALQVPPPPPMAR
jgi:1-phosphatidylinositol-3-phosphate 5-kinase